MSLLAMSNAALDRKVAEVAGLKGYLTADLSPGFGFTGIVVAMLAGLSPVGAWFIFTVALGWMGQAMIINAQVAIIQLAIL